jgi:hypothetical protein
MSLKYAFPGFFKNVSFRSENWVTAAGLFVIAYIVGHLLHVLGSLCVDKVYDWWKETDFAAKWTKQKDRSHLKAIVKSKLTELAETAAKPKEATGLAKLLGDFKTLIVEIAKPGETAGSAKPEETASSANLSEDERFNMLPVYLRIWNAGAGAEMDRLEADQKFFRGLILVLLVVWPSFFMIRVTPNIPALAWWGLLGFLGLLGLTFFLVTLMPLKKSDEESGLRSVWRGLLGKESTRMKAVWVLVLLWLFVPATAGSWYLLAGKVPTGIPAHSAANYSGRLKFWQPGVLAKAPETNSGQRNPVITKRVTPLGKSCVARDLPALVVAAPGVAVMVKAARSYCRSN